MNEREKVQQLADLIYATLPQLIGKKCVFLDLAYYVNIGDVLIWEGSECFLERAGIECIYKASKETYDSQMVPEGITILLQGGGNFGDLWLTHQNFRMKVIANHPNNRIIILPQTIHYDSPDVMKNHAERLSKHKDLYICARDYNSEKLLKENFHSCKILTLPDMAFCIPTDYLHRLCVKSSSGRTLFLKRKDMELAAYDFDKYMVDNVEQHDWPTYETTTSVIRVFNRIKRHQNVLCKISGSWTLDKFCQWIFKPHLIKMGVKFLSRYDYIYTTRLHVAILSTLLEKPFTFFDNSYGKNSSFFEAWLKDVSEIKFIRCNDEQQHK